MTDSDLIAAAVLSASLTHPIRVGIDGFCASGKTTLADALATRVRVAGRQAIRGSADDFQNLPEIRWQLGSRSPEGFRKFQIDFGSLRAMLLEPLGPGGSRRFRSSTFDVRASQPKLSAEFTADPNDVLLLDGLFLHTALLQGCFDFTVFVSCEFETCLERAVARNQEGESSLADLIELYRVKYIPGFVSYLNEVHPEEQASFTVRT